MWSNSQDVPIITIYFSQQFLQRLGVSKNGALISSDWDASAHLAQIISADALSLNFVADQSLGTLLAQFQAEILEESALRGFSNYSAEQCHEFIHGEGTCSKLQSRDKSCNGKYVCCVGKLLISWWLLFNLGGIKVQHSDRTRTLHHRTLYHEVN